MSIRIAPAGTKVEDSEKWVDLTDSFTDVGIALAESMRQIGLVADQARQSFTAFSASFDFMMTRRDRRRMQTAMARATRRQSRIHKGGKP